MWDARRFRRLFRLPPSRARLARELDDELALHLEMRAAEYRARGMDADAARAEALRRFGDLDDARAYCRAEDDGRLRRLRRMRWVAEARDDVRVAVRQLRRSRAFAAAAVLTLAVGIGAATAVYGVVHAYLVRPLPYPDADGLAAVISGPSRDPFPNAPRLDEVDWRGADSLFASTVSWNLDGFTLVGGERPEWVDGAWVTPGYFGALGMRPALGRAFRADEYASAAPVALISDALWTRRYGRDPSIVGRAVRAHSTDRADEPELVTIVGVMPPGTWHISRFTDFLRPQEPGRMPYVVRLPAGTTLAQAEARLNAWVRPQLQAPDPAWHMTLVSLQDDYTQRLRPTLLALLGASLFMLLVAGASVAGALVARAATRRHELDLRAALGASRGRLVRQLLVESLLLALLASMGGVALARLLLVALGSAVGEHLGAAVPDVSGRVEPGTLVLAGALAVGLTVTLLFGLLPALLAARGAGGRALVGQGRGTSTGVGAGAPRVRRLLVAAQIALTTMLLAGAGLMGRTVVALANAPLGFETEGVLKALLLLPRAEFPDSATRALVADRVLAAARATPGVERAAIAVPYPYRNWAPGVPIVAEGVTPSPGADGPRASPFVVGGDYFAVTGMPVLQGRAFGEGDDLRAPRVAMVSAGLARRLWPGASPLGRRVRVDDDREWRTVVGVVPDTRKRSVALQDPDVYVPLAQSPQQFLGLLVRTAGDPAALGPALGRAIGGVSPALALADVEPLAAVVARDGARQRVLATLLATFAAFALGLAVLGLYSSLSFVVAQRARELAVRMAIGADGRAIARLVLGEGAPTVAAGLAVGVGASLALGRVLASQLHGVRAHDPATFAGIVLLLAVTALAAMLAPVRQATRVEPVAVLRE